MNNNHGKKLLGFVFLLIFLSGCTTWNKLVERNERDKPYDEFAEMSAADVKKFNDNPANEDKIICKDEKPTGSNIPQRICRWQSAIKDRSDQDQKAISDMERNSGVGGSGL